MSRALAAILAAAVVAVPATASAYNPVEVHRWIARQAVAHLIANHPGGEYDEALEYLEAIVRGAHDEDDVFLDGDDDPTTVRLFRHFYRPTDGAGLEVDRFGSFPNSLIWALETDHNAWGWNDAFAYYAAGDKEEAYYAVGHIVHLLSDLTVPAHVHLDQHGPPYGDDYENYCTDMTIDQYESMLPLPPSGAPVPEARSLEELWQATANASFWRNMYPGQLSPDGATASGGVLEMFGDRISYSQLASTWKIEGVGNLGKAFHEHEPGYYYFEKLGAEPDVDRVGFVPAEYDTVELGPTGRPMVEQMAEDMIPLAILASAAAIKLFIDSDPRVDPDAETGDGEGNPAGDAGCSASGGASSPVALFLLLVCAAAAGRRRSIRCDR